MDPITHLMTGVCLARAGFNRKAAYATVAITVAAEVPDLDSLWAFDGPVAAFQHHRGWRAPLPRSRSTNPPANSWDRAMTVNTSNCART